MIFKGFILEKLWYWAWVLQRFCPVAIAIVYLKPLTRLYLVPQCDEKAQAGM